MRIGSRLKLGVAAARFWTGTRVGALLVFALVGLLHASVASAVMVDPFTIEEFIGGDAEVTFTLDEGGSGEILLTATVTLGSDDFRGIYFDVADDSLLAGLSISVFDADDASPIINVSIGAGENINVGAGGNLLGGGAPVFFDVGIEIGSPGRGGDFSDTITFLIMHDALDLDLTMFSEQLFGARTTSKGRKLRGEAPTIVPEPATAGLTALGLVMLTVAGRRRRQAA